MKTIVSVLLILFGLGLIVFLNFNAEAVRNQEKDEAVANAKAEVIEQRTVRYDKVRNVVALYEERRERSKEVASEAIKIHPRELPDGSLNFPRSFQIAMIKEDIAETQLWSAYRDLTPFERELFAELNDFTIYRERWRNDKIDGISAEQEFDFSMMEKGQSRLEHLEYCLSLPESGDIWDFFETMQDGTSEKIWKTYPAEMRKRGLVVKDDPYE